MKPLPPRLTKANALRHGILSKALADRAFLLSALCTQATVSPIGRFPVHVAVGLESLYG
jgi:hypothetical protein